MRKEAARRSLTQGAAGQREYQHDEMAEYLAGEVIEEYGLSKPLVWIEHYPEYEGQAGECSLVRFSSWERQEV